MIDYNNMTVDELQAEIDKLESWYEHQIEKANYEFTRGMFPHAMVSEIDATEEKLKHLKALLSRKQDTINS